jgi:hypothetical protein
VANIPGQNWKTPAIRAAEAQVDATAARGQEMAANLEKQGLPPLGPPPDRAAIARQVEEAANKPDAPEALRALKKKVDAGKFTWQDVVAGKAHDDPDVQKAQKATMAKMTQAFQLFQEGHTLKEILEADQPRPARGDDDGDDDGGFVLRDKSW